MENDTHAERIGVRIGIACAGEAQFLAASLVFNEARDRDRLAEPVMRADRPGPLLDIDGDGVDVVLAIHIGDAGFKLDLRHRVVRGASLDEAGFLQKQRAP